MLHVAEEVAEATKGHLDSHTLEMLVETALCLHGFGQFPADSEDDVPEPFVSNFPPERPRLPPWDPKADYSSEEESDIDLYDITDQP